MKFAGRNELWRLRRCCWKGKVHYSQNHCRKASPNTMIPALPNVTQNKNHLLLALSLNSAPLKNNMIFYQIVNVSWSIPRNSAPSVALIRLNKVPQDKVIRGALVDFSPWTQTIRAVAWEISFAQTWFFPLLRKPRPWAGTALPKCTRWVRSPRLSTGSNLNTYQVNESILATHFLHFPNQSYCSPDLK